MKIIIGVYFVIQVLVLSALMVLQFDLTVHSILMAGSCLLYLVVSFKTPGHYKKQIKQLCLSDQIQNQKQKVSFSQKNQTANINPILQENQANQTEHGDDKHQTTSLSVENRFQDPIVKDFKKQSQEKKQVESQAKQHKPIDRQVIQQKQIQAILKDKNSEIRQRYCRVCQIYQPLRVRHCHECQTCVCTFDHHCPWMDNCIGQKNRHLFILYLLVQTIQFLCVLIAVFKGISQKQYLQNVYFFGIGLLIITFLSLSLLCFQCYLMVINLTTWQYVRWDKIQYLNILQDKKSPFSKGVIDNCLTYFQIGSNNQRKQWENDYRSKKQTNQKKQKKQISDNLHNKIKQNISMRQKAQTQRVIYKFSSQID